MKPAIAQLGLPSERLGTDTAACRLKSQIPNLESQIFGLLNRPLEHRVREFRYRFAQTFVFGLPVLALQWFGPRLGGAESWRWIAILQAILCGWIVYIGAVGMLVEGLILFKNRITGDLLVGAVIVALYLWSIGAVLPIFFTGHLAYTPILFHLAVLILLVWSAYRWWQLSRASRIVGGL